MPLALVPLPRAEEAVVSALETPPGGLRSFDLGTVPASVTPPRSWRRAAWFAIGTSAAVVCGLAVAAVRLVGAPSATDTIDALPAFPTEPLDLEELPAEHTAENPTEERVSPSSGSVVPTGSERERERERETRTGEPSGNVTTTGAGRPGTTGTTTGTETGTGTGTSETSTEPAPPTRTTVGAALLMATDTQEMGDRTEQYFALVTEDPEAAHSLCTGTMAREGPEGIKARYAGVERVEVQQITIDRTRAITTSQVRLVREDGSATVERRQLTFTWGTDPRISDEVITN
ncbi:hypothetical protein [Actinophytocola gossypii]|uniref:Nuclear transport factor 2 family protein n=1 Tax=Actinophytocola gossypii TaxID=2812003 RepID=A0ABT2JJR4_9PSEU|nr:hypothetical protein [Actinophytocola gossypii]MCT2588134.1 hypothetical protein [Actinophytocola gossypii]